MTSAQCLAFKPSAAWSLWPRKESDSRPRFNTPCNSGPHTHRTRLRKNVRFITPCKNFLSLCRSFTAAVSCVPALRVPFLHSVTNHFRQNFASAARSRRRRSWMIEPPSQAASCSPGALRVATGAALFAITNAVATALYRRGGASVVSLYVIRSPIVYVANVAIVALQEGTPAASNVLLLRTGSATATRLALTRSLLNSLKQILLSVAFVYLTCAQAG